MKAETDLLAVFSLALVFHYGASQRPRVPSIAPQRGPN
jgi:hypothetical protein